MRIEDASQPGSSHDQFSSVNENEGGTTVVQPSKAGAPVVDANARVVGPGPDGVVLLPAGVELDDVRVVGRDLVIDMPDGTQMVVVDGALFMPRLVLGDVELPAANLAALLIGEEIRPAAGPPQSSGGNFALDVGPLDAGLAPGDGPSALLAATALDYTPPSFSLDSDSLEIAAEAAPDAAPAILITTAGQPLGAESATATVNENALGARGAEPAGSDSASSAETVTGTIVFTSDAPSTVTINAVAVTSVGQTIAATFGTVTITSIADGAIGYSYTLSDNVLGAAANDLLTVEITDADGDIDAATLTIAIVDDVPAASADADSVSEAGPLVADGNVLGNDTSGADGATVTALAFGGASGTIGAPLQGAFGSIVLGADGGYVYTLDAQKVGALGAGETATDVFTYTITDGDGDVSSATLTISIGGANDVPTIAAATATVSEEGLAAGNGDTAGVPTDVTNSATASGQLAIADVDGDALTVTLGLPADGLTSRGQPIVWSLSGDAQQLTGSAGGVAVVTVTVTDTGAYTVALSGPVDHPDASGEDVAALVIPVSVSDGVASVATTLTVSIEDDSPVVGTPVIGASVVIDESDGASPLGVGAPLVATSAAAIISGAPSFGADGPGATVFGLALLGGASTIASGLQTALGDQPITLTLTSATLITATYAGGTQTAFTIAMNNDGTVTVTQFVALEHRVDGAAPADHDDVLNLLGEGGSLVSATATYSDFDGDAATATVAIGAAIQFADDGPSVALQAAIPVDGAALAALQLTTGDDGTEGAGSTSDSTGAGFGGVFTLASDGGADGTAGTTLGYQLGLLVSQGAASGLASGGAAINLYLVGGTVIGSTSLTAPVSLSDSSVIFAIATDAGGSVTLTQFSQVDHDGEDPSTAPFGDQLAILGSGVVELVATASISDQDGDVASDVERLDLGGFVRFADDGPAISAALAAGAGLRIDESDGVAAGDEIDPVGGDLGSVTVAAASLVTVTPGAPSADAPTTLSYSLAIGAPGIASGLLLSSTDAAIVLVDNAGVIEGRAGGIDGALAFTVSVDAASGAVTLTQFLAVEHADLASDDEDSNGVAAGVLNLAVTATDFDGDTASASVDLGAIIRFEDDGPSLDVIATVPADEAGRAALRLVTSDDGTEGDGFTVATSAAAFGGVFSLAVDPGADGSTGLPAIGYALDLLVAGGSVSGLTSQGNPIYIHDVGGTIVGSTSIAPPLTTTDASIVFAVAVSSGGVVTLTQYAQIDHAGDLASLGNDLVELVASATITDHDGDVASDVERLDLGGFVAFDDDGPSISAELVAGTTITVDETDGEVSAGESDVPGGNLGSTTLAAASLFTLTTDPSSADAPTTTAFALSISAAGVASGLLLSSTNEVIVLVGNGGMIEGRVGGVDGALAFSVSIDPASGAVTLTQFLAVEHGDIASNDEASSGLTAGVLSIAVTATDFDGDVASARVDLGAIIRFDDDGPAIAVTADAAIAAGVLLTTTDDGTETGTTTASGDFGGAFVLAFTAGSDGAASPALAYALGTAGGASGLTSGGAAINLFNVGGIIVGTTAAASESITAANTIFAVAVDSEGVVTLTQSGAIDHVVEVGDNDAPFADQLARLAGDAVTLTASATITDNDGDAASDAVTIAIGASLRFADDGPAITAALVAGARLRIDESDGVAADGEVDPLGGNLGTVTVAAATLVRVTAGPSADAPTMTGYALSISTPGVASGLLHSATGAAIVLVANGGTIEGRVGAIDGALAFTVSIDAASGATTLTQFLAVEHDDDASNDEDSDGLTAGVLGIDVTATDFDGDTASASVDLGSIIRFEDDGPASFVADTTAFANSGTFDNLAAPAALNLANAVGADGLGRLTFADDNASDDFLRDAGGAFVTSGGARIVLSGYGTDTLVGRTESGGLTVFTLAVDPGTDTYSVDFDRAFDDPGLVSLNALGFATIGARAFNVVNVPGTTEDLLFSGFNRSAANAVTIGSVNSNGTAIGVNNAAMNDGDNLRIDFVNSPTVTTTGGINNVYNYSESPGHYTVNNFSFAIVRVDAATPADGIEIWVRVYDADNADPPGSNTGVHFAELADDQQQAITAIQVNGVALDLTTLTTDGNGGYLVRGLDLDDRVTVGRAGGYDRILIENAGSRTTAPDESLVGDVFDIGRYAYTTSTSADPLTLNFDLALEDSDGDRIVVENAITLSSDLSAPATARDAEVSQRAAASATSAALMTGAVAAMGLAASQAAAPEAGDDRQGAIDGERTSQAAVAPQVPMASVEPDQSRSLLDNETRAVAKDEPASTDLGASEPSASENGAADAAGQATPLSALLASETPSSDSAAAIVVAPMIVLPSADAIAAVEAPQDGSGIQRSGTVEKILAEALEGGAGGGEVDALLAALTGPSGEAGSALAALAIVGGETGGWDPAPVASLTIADMAAFHHDTVQPAING